MENTLAIALQHLERNPAAKLTTVAREFGIPRHLLRSRAAGHPPKNRIPASNTKLSRPEEAALVRYIDRLDAINLAVPASAITEAANYILKGRASSAEREKPTTVGGKWTTRFIKRHGYARRKQKTLNKDRQASEDVVRVEEYFKKLQKVLLDEGIPPESIWNMDETGFRIGIGKDQLIVTKRKKAHYFGIPENRESATAIECVSAGGNYLPAFLILSGQLHMAQWYQLEELHPETAIRLAPNGYSNDVISLEWLQHFEKHSAKSSIGVKRLLILDGHGSHHTRQFIRYCDDHNIIPFGMPPHLTHLLQPLDVVVFQPLKHYHAKALEAMIRDGLTNITKVEFLSLIQGVRIQAFKKETILSSFAKTGISPFRPSLVLEKVRAREAERTPSPQPHMGSSPFNTPITLRQMNKVAEQLREAEYDLSPESGRNLKRFISGSLATATELIQVKRDLGKTKLAATLATRRRAMKNKPLQSGGILTVAKGREMVEQSKEKEEEKVAARVDAARLKRRNIYKRLFEDAAKEARKRRRVGGPLEPAEIVDSEGVRLLRRF